MKTSLKPVVVSLLFVAIVGVAAGPAHSATEATRISDLGGGKISALVPWNGGLWLGVENDTHGEVWFSDGTAAGTVQVNDLPETTDQDYWMTIRNVMPAGNALIFNYLYAQDYYGMLNLVPNSVWMSDGTTAGTVMLSDSGYPRAEYTGTLGNITYFHTVDYSFDVYNFWRSDGTQAGTYAIKPDLETWNGLAVNNLLYFCGVTTSLASFSLWRTDGTTEGTYTLQPDGGACNKFLEIGGIVYWCASSVVPARLFRTDGTIAGTYTLQPSGGTCDGVLFVMNDVLFFSGATGTGAHGLFRSDGTVSGTYQIAEVSPEGFGYANSFVLGDTAVFEVTDSGTHSLWKTDGTAEGTTHLMDVYPARYAVFGDALYFLAGTTGGEGLWKTDGTTAGTGLVYGFDLWGYTFMATTDQHLLFWCEDEMNNANLYMSDGTTAGTVPIITPWDPDKLFPTQSAEVAAAGAEPAKNLPPPPINQVWSQNGVVYASCYNGDTLARLDGMQLQVVTLHDSAIDVSDYVSGLHESRPVALGDGMYYCGTNGGLWAESTNFRFTRTPYASWREVGDPLLLTVGCAGYIGSISYQWLKDGGLIDGATSAEFRIDSVTQDDEGWYSCRVTDGTKAVHETEPVLVEVFEEDSLPAAGPLALFALAAACTIGAARAIKRRKI